VFGHGWDLYGEVIDVPMLIKPPGHTGSARISEVAQHVDVVPTVLAAVGLEVPQGVEGLDLLQPIIDTRHAHSYMDYEGREGIAVVDGVWKVIEPLSEGFTPGPELYERSRDAGEQVNLAGEYPVRVGYLRALARRHLLDRRVAIDSQEVSELDDETRRALEALGYLE
jgi:arylsulfatase A-like enzyme